MPRRISAEIDMQILAEIGNNVSHKEIAAKYGVSPSYVSKLSLGKKVPDIHVTPPPKVFVKDFEAYEGDIDDAVKMIDKLRIVVDDESILGFLDVEINRLIIRTKMFITLKNIYKGEH